MTPARALMEIREHAAAGMYHLARGVAAKLKSRKIRTSMILRVLLEATACIEEDREGAQRWRFDDHESYGLPLRVVVELDEGVLIISAHWIE